jgi:hypothetical protein
MTPPQKPRGWGRTVARGSSSRRSVGMKNPSPRILLFNRGSTGKAQDITANGGNCLA